MFLCIVAAAMLCACDQDVVVNTDFSVNVFQPGPKWPNVKKLTPAQKEIFERYGKPDNFRVIWGPTMPLKTRIEVQFQMDKMKPKDIPPYSWIYLRHNKEIIFNGASYEEKPLADDVRLITKYGDPEDVKEDTNGSVQWMYYSVGKQFKIRDGKIFEQKDFPAMGQFNKP